MTKYVPKSQIAKEKVISIVVNGLTVEVIIRVKDDHPMLITIDLLRHEFDVEGYD